MSLTEHVDFPSTKTLLMRSLPKNAIPRKASIRQLVLNTARDIAEFAAEASDGIMVLHSNSVEEA